MTEVDFTQIELDNLITHHVGSPHLEEDLVLSQEVSQLSTETESYLLRYFILPFKTEEFFKFSHSVEIGMNEVYNLTQKIFANPDELINCSQSLAKLLFQHSTHPKIKAGEFNAALFSNIVIDNKVVNALGLFKSETETPFIEMQQQKGHFNIQHQYGFELKNIDKGCLIFDIDQESGYKLLIIDHANKGNEALYWREDFLQVATITSEFHHTKQFLDITKNFVTQKMSEEFEVSKTDQIDLLNRSVSYFKTHEKFEKEDFEEEVLQQDDIINSFRSFDRSYRAENDIEVEDSFDISATAVKKQAKIFKSVLKLDKNFHIYIHGNKNLIEKGEDETGRKFYKIYFNEES